MPFEHGHILHRELVHAVAEPPDPGQEGVVGDDRGDGGAEARCSGDERLGDSGGDDADVGRLGQGDVLKGVHDPPDGAEEPDERGGAAGGGQKDHPLLETRGLGRGSPEKRTRHRLHVGHREAGGLLASGPGLVANLLVAGGEEPGERAPGVFGGRGDDLGQTPGGPELAQERRRVPLGLPEAPPLAQDDGPGDEAEEQECRKDRPGDRAGLDDQGQETVGAEHRAPAVGFDRGNRLLFGGRLARKDREGGKERDCRRQKPSEWGRKPGGHEGGAGNPSTQYMVAEPAAYHYRLGFGPAAAPPASGVGWRAGRPRTSIGAQFPAAMLHWLRARNIALLRDVSLDFGDGLNVVTGETGAGKSILLEALGLVLGGRGSAGLVGPEGARAVVEAGFSQPAGGARFRAACAEAGVPADDGEIVVRRELRLGKGSVTNRTTVNGAAVPVASLRSVGMLLAEVYSQGEQLALLAPGAARETVDAIGGRRELLEGVAAAYRRLRETEARRDGLEARLRQTQVLRTGMESALSEIERAAPEPRELEGLLAERRLLAEAERLIGRLSLAYDALYGSDRAAGAQLAVALRALDEAAGLDPATARLLEGRADLLVEVEDLAAAVRDRREEIRAGPERLAEIEDRIALLRGLERRHAGGSGGTEALLARAQEMRRALAELTDQADERRKAAAEAEAGVRRYLELADSLSRSRRRSAEALSRGVREELAGLGIPGARFRVRIESAGDPAGASADGPRATGHFAEHGLDRLEFLFSAGPEIAPAPIGQVASGGESSRFFLALKAAGAGKGGAPTLVFDEADTGTSGRIADAVGRRLRRLAGSRQVVSVTHLPQVAALGRSHLVVEKLESGGSIRVRRLTGRARIEEIARMLAGPEITESAREHARALLAGAEVPVAGAAGA